MKIWNPFMLLVLLLTIVLLVLLLIIVLLVLLLAIMLLGFLLAIVLLGFLLLTIVLLVLLLAKDKQHNGVPDFHKDYACTKFGQNPLKDINSRVFRRMLHSKNLTW
jgi:amino acid transporter